jgi:hypothetical protein
MSILTNQLPNSNLGLKNQTPPTFGTVPAGALHNTYSTNGTPSISWNSANSTRVIPKPSQLDDLKSLYTPGAGSYLQNLPQ